MKKEAFKEKLTLQKATLFKLQDQNSEEIRGGESIFDCAYTDLPVCIDFDDWDDLGKSNLICIND